MRSLHALHNIRICIEMRMLLLAFSEITQIQFIQFYKNDMYLLDLLCLSNDTSYFNILLLTCGILKGARVPL